MTKRYPGETDVEYFKRLPEEAADKDLRSLLAQAADHIEHVTKSRAEWVSMFNSSDRSRVLYMKKYRALKNETPNWRRKYQDLKKKYDSIEWLDT